MNPNQYSNPFMSSFFTKPLVGSIVHTHKFICGESEILDIVEGGNKESVIANMTLSEVLATWINHQLSTKLIEGINKFTKTYQFTQLLSKCQKLSELYTKDQKGFFLHFRKDYQFRKEMHTMNFTNGIVILALMLSLKPQKINYHSYLELHFDSPEARYAAIRQHLEKLKINFDLNDLMTNNTTSITQLFAHLFVIHHSLGSDKSESLFHSAIIKQIANSFMPFFGRAIGTKLLYSY